MDFAGGLNSETSNEKLRDNEFPTLDNIDLSSRGSAKRRTGRKLLVNQPGVGQGIFFFYRQGEPKPDVLFAVSGKIYVLEHDATEQVEVPILDGETPFTFQTTRTVEAVQYGPDMFLATGTKLCELTYKADTAEWEAKVVTPYSPSVMEAIYIGTNGLADNPDAYVQDGTGTLEAVGIKPAKRTGVVNESMSIVAYINRPTDVTAAQVEYKWEYKKAVEVAWTVGRDFTADVAGKTWTFKPDTATKYDLRVTIRKAGTTTPTPQYALTNYVVNQVEDKTQNTSRPVTGIQSCNKVRLHWDRLLLAGDTDNPFQMYISDLNVPRYFPVSNTITFDTGKQEPVTSIIRYRDMLVVFTKTTIQTLVGKSPEDYRRSLIHDGIGCIAERSAAVTGNNIMFLSAEGIHMLKPNQFILEVMNVSRIDYPIKSSVVSDERACAMVFDSQYWLCFPSQSVIYRLYYDNAMWVRDKSSKLNFVEMAHYGSDVYELSQSGQMYRQDRSLYADAGEVYEAIMESKFLDLSASFNQKKLKRLYVLARHFAANVDLQVKVQADSEIILNPEDGEAVIENGYVAWKVVPTPNMHFYTGTVVGSWVVGKTPLGDIQISVQKASIRGRCRRVKVTFTHEDPVPCEIFGFGLEFKEKKP